MTVRLSHRNVTYKGVSLDHYTAQRYYLIHLQLSNYDSTAES